MICWNMSRPGSSTSASPWSRTRARPSTYLPLAQLDMVCACPADSPLAQLSFVGPDRSAQHAADQRPHVQPHQQPGPGGLPPQCRRLYAPAIDVRFMNVAGHFVEEGLGVTIMDELTASSKRYSRLRSVPFKAEDRGHGVRHRSSRTACSNGSRRR